MPFLRAISTHFECLKKKSKEELLVRRHAAPALPPGDIQKKIEITFMFFVELEC
jgi:hypothetical protein